MVVVVVGWWPKVLAAMSFSPDCFQQETETLSFSMGYMITALGGFQPDPGIPAADCPPSQNQFSLPLCFPEVRPCKVQCLLVRSKNSLKSFPNRKRTWESVARVSECRSVLEPKWPSAQRDEPLATSQRFSRNVARLPGKFCHISKSTELLYSVLCPDPAAWYSSFLRS